MNDIPTSAPRQRSSNPLLRGVLIVTFLILALILAGVLFMRWQLAPVDTRAAQTSTQTFENSTGLGGVARGE